MRKIVILGILTGVCTLALGAYSLRNTLLVNRPNTSNSVELKCPPETPGLEKFTVRITGNVLKLNFQKRNYHDGLENLGVSLHVSMAAQFEDPAAGPDRIISVLPREENGVVRSQEEWESYPYLPVVGKTYALCGKVRGNNGALAPAVQSFFTPSLQNIHEIVSH